MNPLLFYRQGKRIATLTPSQTGDSQFTLGTVSANDIVVTNPELAEKHLRFHTFSGIWWVEDISGQNNLLVNGHACTKSPLVQKNEISIGTVFDFSVETESSQTQVSDYDTAREWLYETVTGMVAQDMAGKAQMADAALEEKVTMLLGEIIAGNPSQLLMLNPEKKETMRREIVEDMLKLGPLEPLIADDSITEIMVIDYKHIYIEQKGKVTLSGRHFRSPEHLVRVIERIVTPVGRRVDESSPLVDARLADGSRVNAVIPPITPDGACLTIRKFGKSLFTLEKLISIGSMTPEMAAFIEASVMIRKNIIVSGGTGSGKTSLLNAISLCIGQHERIVTIEDSLELKLQQSHVVRMEARPANAEGKGEVSIRTLVKNSLRMRPDRIVVGECRSGEALDMLQAMNTGHDGSLTTVHANTPLDTVSRLEILCLMAGMDLPVSAIRAQIASAVDLIIQTNRLSDGSRKVVSISELTGLDEKGQPVMNEIFRFDQTGIDPKTRKVKGQHNVCSVPTYLDEFAIRGIPFDKKCFDGVKKA